MPSCERCWSESGGDVKRYKELVDTRDCTPEEQAGEGAEECENCKRYTVHIYCKVCMACGHRPAKLNTKELL